MAADTPPTPTQDISELYARMYYEHQYARLDALENQRLVVTLTVISVSAAAFALNTIGDPTSITNGAVVPVIVAAFNLFGIAYLIRVAELIGVHDKRAKEVLERFARPIFELDKGIPFPDRNRIGGRNNIHIYVHVTIAIIAVLLMIARAVL